MPWESPSPSHKNPHIIWIHATTITAKEWAQIPKPESWIRGNTLKRATACRLNAGKNTIAIIRAMPLLESHYPDISLFDYLDLEKVGKHENKRFSLAAISMLCFPSISAERMWNKRFWTLGSVELKPKTVF